MTTRLNSYTAIKGSVQKLPCLVATTGNTDLISGNSPISIDDVYLSTNDRILVHQQLNSQENGIYVVITGGTWERSIDFSIDKDVYNGLSVYVNSGNTYSRKLFYLDCIDPVTLNTTPLSFYMPVSVSEMWTTIEGTYYDTTGFTFTGTDKDVNLIEMSLFTCTDSGGTIRRIGYVKSSSNNSGTITVNVVTDTDLANGDIDFKIAYNRKVWDYVHMISIPGEVIADASYSQGLWLQDVMVDSYLLPVDASVLTAALGSGAACSFNVYKGTNNLFSADPDLVTNAVLRNQRPTTNTISAGDNISLRIKTSNGATNKASDFQCKLFIVPQKIFLAF